MKILFVDAREPIQEKWVEPLRSRGWGVLLARSIEDATKMMMFHENGISGLVVNEKFASFAEQSGLPFVILTQNWTDQEVLRHRNSPHPAQGYLPPDSNFEAIFKIFTRERTAAHEPQAGRTGLRLIDVSKVLERPEKTNTQRTLSLGSPSRVLGGGSTTVLRKEETLAIPLEVEPMPESEPGSPGPAEPEEPAPAPPVEPLRLVPIPDDSPPDLATLRFYLTMREQDVAVLTGQVRSSKDRIEQLEAMLKMEKARNTEMGEMLFKAEQRIKNYDLEKQVDFEVMQKQVDDLEEQLREKTEKARAIETKLRLMSEEVTKVKDRVRIDIRRIRVREKELEGQLEILRKDSSALLHARDEKILELKRRIDLLEFNMELVQEQYDKERKACDDLRAKLKDAAQAMRQANGLLET